MENCSFKKRFLIICTAAALLLNALLPFYAAYDAESIAAKLSEKAATQELSTLLGDKILICTGDGFKWVTRDALQSGEEQPAQHPRMKCPLCYLAAFGVKQIMPSMTASLDSIPSSVDDILYSRSNDITHAIATTYSYDSQAPPASV